MNSLPSLHSMPEEIVYILMDYLQGDDQSILATAAVCKGWQQEINLQFMREEAQARCCKNHYYTEMVGAFKRAHTPIHRLPILNLKNREGKTGYVDFIKPKDMERSVMKFIDSNGRYGIALKIRASRKIVFENLQDYIKRTFGRTRVLENMIDYACELKPLLPGCEEEAVLAVFQVNNFPHREWQYSWGKGKSDIEGLINWRHMKNNEHAGSAIHECRRCPLSNRKIHPRLLENLLKGQDPDFSLPDRKKIFDKTSKQCNLRIDVIGAIAVMALAYFLASQNCH